ncbi:MAG: sigma-70 family RNA polymerase sigma factor, partial [Pseudomonadota bacterium]
ADDPAASSDAALVAQAGRGEDRAFNTLVRAYAGFVHTLALRYLQNRADAEEVAQAVFLALWVAAPKWRPEAQLRTWLFKVTVNKCIDRARRARRWSWLRSGDMTAAFEATLPDPTPPASEAAEAASELARVRRAMAKLAPRQRMALMLVAEPELSGKDASAIMGVTPGAFEQLLVRGRKALRKVLEMDDE